MIGVVGSGDPEKRHDPQAAEVGRQIALHGAVLVCGGLSGIMEASSRGASLEGGTVIGFLPGSDKNEANPHVTFPVPTGMGVARNVLIIKTADIVIALPGGPGTLSEIALSLNIGKQCVDLGGWNIEGMVPAATAEEAVGLAFDLCAEKSGCEGREAAPGK
ncbi:MAG: TIGR00725 family protein [Pseudomonadota bacterium]